MAAKKRERARLEAMGVRAATTEQLIAEMAALGLPDWWASRLHPKYQHLMVPQNEYHDDRRGVRMTVCFAQLACVDKKARSVEGWLVSTDAFESWPRVDDIRGFWPAQEALGYPAVRQWTTADGPAT